MDLASERVVQGIQRWLDANKHHSLKLLSDRTRLGYSTIRHIMQQERPVTMQTALLLLAEVATRAEAVEIISQSWPQYGQALKQYFAGSAAEQLISKEFDQLDELSWRLHSMCKVAQSIKDIEKALGTRGVERAAELVELGLLQEESGKLVSPDIAANDIRRLSELVKLSADVLMSQSSFEKTAVFCFADRTDAVGVKVINDALIDFANKVKGVLGRGDIPVNVSTIAGRIETFSPAAKEIN